MKLLIAYSDEQWGYDDALSAFIKALNQVPAFIGPHTTLALAVDRETLPSDVSFDAVICVNALSWYIENRIKLKGRPWVGIVSFAMQDLHEFVRNISSAHDMGIGAMFTNCQTFVKQCSAVWPVAFMRRPSLTLIPELRCTKTRPTKFGTVLPNVLDRDFSQLALTIRYLQELKEGWQLSTFVREDDMHKLPDAVRPNRVALRDIDDAYSSIEYFIPAPRITDLRVGLPAYEVIEAIAHGCAPLLFTNPRVNELDRYVSPHFTSLSSYKDAIKSILGGAVMVDTSSVTHLLPPPQLCATQVWSAFVRWMSNNVPTSTG